MKVSHALAPSWVRGPKLTSRLRTRARAQFGRVVVEGNLGVREHHEEAAFLRLGLCNPLVQGIIARDGRKQRLELPIESRSLRRRRALPIGQQLVVVRPEIGRASCRERVYVLV